MKSTDGRKDIKPPRRRAKKRRADRRGVALVMVLGAITVLTVFLTELQEETSSELSAALVERDSVRAEYYARSAINLSRLLIAMEPKIRASIPFISMLGLKQLPVWKYQDMVLGPFNDKESTQSFTSMINADPATGKNLGLSGGGHFELSIVDEDSKLNINIASQNNFTSRDSLARQLMALMSSPEYNPLFEGRDLDNQFSDRQAICGALIDWADSSNTGNEELSSCDLSDTKTTTGTEDNFYQMAGLGYLRKNAAYDSLQELRLARGISDDFWSTFIDPDPTNPDKRNVTVWGQGKINLNTANAQTLLSVICSEKVAALTLCADVNQIVPLLQLLSMAKAILPPGVPLFGSADELINFLKTGGQSTAGTSGGKSAQAFSISSMILPMFMSTLGITLQPVPITNPGIIKQQLGNTSKIFSIYADGVVPGFRKTTKVRIHTVVDFRLAQGLGEAVAAIAADPSNPIPPAALDALQRSNPAGTVIYWRVE